MNSKSIVHRNFKMAGVEVNGSREFDIRVHDDRFYSRALRKGFLGLGESYMDGWWDCDRIDLLCEMILKAGYSPANKWGKATVYFFQSLMNLQSKARSRMVIDAHYDIGNDLYKSMLDPKMNYTCAYWQGGAKDLISAQEAKLDLICRKLNLRPGMRVLDIGCGFGSFMKFAVENYGVSCVGYSLSKNQIELGRELCQGHDIKFIEKDYRDIQGKFDAVASIGMFEAVGKKTFRIFMEVLERSMNPETISLLHTIGTNHTMPTANAWYNKYIFPNGIIPSAMEMTKAMDKLVFINDWHTFGTSYDLTLLDWNKNFQKGWDELHSKKPSVYNARFKRMWEFYLLSIASAFRTRTIDLWQISISLPRSPVVNWRHS